MEMKIFVDVDDVCADLMPAWLARYNRDYQDSLTREQITGWSLLEHVKPECGLKIYDYLEDPTLYDDVGLIDGALNGVNSLREMGHRVIFATSSTNGAAGRKLRWLIEHDFLKQNPKRVYHDYIEIHDKSLLAGDVLIDDGPHNVKNFKGLGVLMRRPHNRGEEWPVTVNSWGDAIELCSSHVLPVGTHITELTRPLQTRAFREIIEQMYAVHLQKNADYSPANILGAGEIGLMTRTWDKVSRLMNLMGFKLEIASMRFGAPTAPKCEAIEDTILDLSVYAIIWQLYRRGAWGK